MAVLFQMCYLGGSCAVIMYQVCVKGRGTCKFGALEKFVVEAFQAELNETANSQLLLTYKNNYVIWFKLINLRTVFMKVIFECVKVYNISTVMQKTEV